MQTFTLNGFNSSVCSALLSRGTISMYFNTQESSSIWIHVYNMFTAIQHTQNCAKNWIHKMCACVWCVALTTINCLHTNVDYIFTLTNYRFTWHITCVFHISANNFVVCYLNHAAHHLVTAFYITLCPLTTAAQSPKIMTQSCRSVC